MCPTSQRFSLSRHAESVTSFDGENSNCDLPMTQPTSGRRSLYLPQERGKIVETRKHIPEVLQSRRYATDFGLGRYNDVQPSSLPPVPPPYLPQCSSSHRADSSVSSTGSTPSSQDPETDSSLSLYEDFSREFPQPPPIRSPVLRRMKSSPWLTDQRTRAVEKHAIKQSANVRLTSSGQRNSKPGFSPSTSCGADLKCPFIVDFEEMAKGQIHNPDHKDLDLEMVGEALVGLEMNSFVSESSIQGMSDEVENSTVISAGAELLRWSTLHRATPPLATRTSISPVNRPLTISQDENAQVSDNSDFRSRPPQTIRKVASMREQVKDSELTTIIAHRPLPKIKSLRFIPPRNWDLPPTSASNKEANTGTAFPRPPPGANRRGALNSAEVERSLPKTPYPSLTINGVTQKLSHRPHQSVPLAGLGFSDAALFKCQASRPQPLAAPFSHRPSLTVATEGYKGGAIPMPKSFIDITPERATAPVTVRKERVKSFIARASNGVKNWSRQFAKKTQSSG